MSRRHTLNIDEDVLREAAAARPGLTKTALVDAALRALVEQEAALRLAALEGSVPDFERPKRSAWSRGDT